MVNIISLNVRGLRDSEKRRAVFNFYRSRCDILCLQETHSEEKDEVVWNAEWGRKGLFSHWKTNSRGVAIFFKKNLIVDVSQVQTDENGRWIIFLLMEL